MDPNVDLSDLARRTKNFSGAEIEGLVRAAQSSAMNRLVKVISHKTISYEMLTWTNLSMFVCSVIKTFRDANIVSYVLQKKSLQLYS